jgi:hypothetical protein
MDTGTFFVATLIVATASGGGWAPAADFASAPDFPQPAASAKKEIATSDAKRGMGDTAGETAIIYVPVRM